MMIALLAETMLDAPESLAIGYGWLMIKMIIVLVIVCVVAVLVLKYMVPKLSLIRHRAQGECITIVSRRSLDPKRHVWIIAVGKRHFLIGSGDAGITCLAELTAQDLGGDRAGTNPSS